jgi:hypothetical protein
MTAPANNGMHPTRDTADVIYLLRLRRAGDAGRYAASYKSKVQVKIHWISGVEPGRLGIMPRPRGGDWLEP